MKKSILRSILITALAIAMCLTFVGCSNEKTCKICNKTFEVAEHNIHSSVDGDVYI